MIFLFTYSGQVSRIHHALPLLSLKTLIKSILVKYHLNEFAIYNEIRVPVGGQLAESVFNVFQSLSLFSCGAILAFNFNVLSLLILNLYITWLVVTFASTGINRFNHPYCFH